MKKVLLFFSLMLALAAQADVLGEYPKAKKPAPILVVGAPTSDDG